MTQVVAFVPDLLFGSNVLGMLRSAGYDAELVNELEPERLAQAEVVVVDLTADAAARLAAVRDAVPGHVRTLGFYSHVETDVRALAEEAGIDLVVPRSRLAREGAALVERLVGAG